MGQLCTYLPGGGRQVKQGRKGHKKDIENAPCGGAGRRLGLLLERVSGLSSQPLYLAWRPWPSERFPVRRPPRLTLTPESCNHADVDPSRAWPGPESFAPPLLGTAATALGGDVARTRRRAPRAFLFASIAAAGLVFGAQAGHAAELANGSVAAAATAAATAATTGAASGAAKWAARKGAISVTIDDGRLTLSAPGARLDRVLRRIAAEAGFKVFIRGDLGAPSPYTAMNRVPLERALWRLFGGSASDIVTSMVILYEPPRDGVANRIAEVRVHARPPPLPDARP